MRLTLIPDLTREQDRGSLLRFTNIWLKSWTECLHGVVFEYAGRKKKIQTTVDRWDNLRAPKSASEHLNQPWWLAAVSGRTNDLWLLPWPAGQSNILSHMRGIESDEMKIHHIYWSRWSRMHKNFRRCCIKTWNIHSTFKSLNFEYQQFWFEDFLSFPEWWTDYQLLICQTHPLTTPDRLFLI